MCLMNSKALRTTTNDSLVERAKPMAMDSAMRDGECDRIRDSPLESNVQCVLCERMRISVKGEV